MHYVSHGFTLDILILTVYNILCSMFSKLLRQPLVRLYITILSPMSSLDRIDLQAVPPEAQEGTWCLEKSNKEVVKQNAPIMARKEEHSRQFFENSIFIVVFCMVRNL